MYQVSAMEATSLPGYARTYAPGKMTLGLFFPIEAYERDMPSMRNQVTLSKKAEAAGFASLWFRDVPLRDPSFGDAGQIFDPWAYLGFIAGQTRQIALGTAAIVVPIRHPLHIAKAAASIDQLSGGRLLLGVASGDRPVEYPAFNVNPEKRGDVLRESVEVMGAALGNCFVPIQWSSGLMSGADLIPKPLAKGIPLFVTGQSRQPMEWIAANAHGWITYQRAPDMQREVIKAWRTLVADQCGNVFKPISQSLYIDLSDDPDQPPVKIHQGYIIGRNPLLVMFQELESAGMNHILIQLKYGRRQAADVIDELAEFILPHFQALPVSNPWVESDRY
jgi:luciferase-type oxidoreductase